MNGKQRVSEGQQGRSNTALTARALAKINPGAWLSDTGRKGAGRLVAYGMKAGGVAFYFRYTGPSGDRDTLPLGHHDADGRHGLTLKEATLRAQELSRRYQAGERDLRAILDAEQREAVRQRRAHDEADAAAIARAKATLGVMLEGYVAQLRRDGKSSADRVGAALRLHVGEAWPKLWSTPAADVTTDDLLAVVALLVDAEKPREAAKVRAYLSAAYNAAIRARQDARGLAELRELKISSNPARDLVAVGEACAPRDRALSLAELQSYWRRIAALPGAAGALLRFHLLTGGQRIEQLARLTTADVDHDNSTMKLLDGKGRRRRPRAHFVPLIPAALDALKTMVGKNGPFAFTVSGGNVGAGYHVFQHRLRQVSEAMVEAGDAAPFTAGDLRRTIETRLAAEGVSTDVRAQLQSHGLGGIQSRHYDRHDYDAEKRAALETLYRLVTASGATVTSIKRARGRKA